MSNLTFSQYQQRNDYIRKIEERIRPLEAFATVEQRIRQGLRKMVACELKYTTRGKRGVGRTNERLLDRIRNYRAQHAASIRRQHEWGAVG
jgi:hypothetical protein